MQSVNQISAQIKLTEIWKAVSQPKYPIKVTKQSTTPNARTTRGVTSGKLMETGSSNQSLNSFLGNAHVEVILKLKLFIFTLII